MPTNGVMKSLTSDFTTAVNAVPITMPIARSTTLPRRMKVRKPDRSRRRVPERTRVSSLSRGSRSVMPAEARSGIAKRCAIVRAIAEGWRIVLGAADVAFGDGYDGAGDPGLDGNPALAGNHAVQ